MIPKLEPSLKDGSETQSAYLCSDHTDYIPSGFMDSGWGCGYRNCQMLLSFLEKEKQDGRCLLKYVIDIISIQLLIEKAWQEGNNGTRARPMFHTHLHPQASIQQELNNSSTVYSKRVNGLEQPKCTAYWLTWVFDQRLLISISLRRTCWIGSNLTLQVVFQPTVSKKCITPIVRHCIYNIKDTVGP